MIAVLGPTAVGKTSVSIELAKIFDAEIVSTDSRQFFMGLPIGTAQPTAKERKLIKHHFVDFLPLTKEYSAGKFEVDAINEITELHKTNKSVIITGGSGLYVNAVLYGLDNLPEANKIIRQELNAKYQQFGIEYLQKRLLDCDKQYYEMVDLQNPRRIIRALEIFETTGKSILSFQNKTPKKRNFDSIIIGLERNREELYARINFRVDLMFKEGLLDEARMVYKYKNHNALQTVGYKELFDFFEDKIDLEEAIRLIKRNSRRYAKRQLTWLRKQDNIHWFKPKELYKICTFVRQKIE